MTDIPEDVSPLTDKAVARVSRHASEGGHWYNEAGEQIAEVLNADGSRYIAPSLVHARKLQLAPGITSILRCIDKPALTLWKQRQAIMAALTLPRRETEPEGEWMARVEQDMGETAKKAAEEGTMLHKACETYLQGGEPLYPSKFHPYAESVSAYLDGIDPCGGWVCEQSGSHRWGYGTKADVRNINWLIDFKSKDGGQSEIDAAKLYDEHHMQLAATLAMLDLDHPLRCGILFVSRTEPGVQRLVESTPADLQRGLLMFRTMLTFWQQKNRYRPSWARD